MSLCRKHLMLFSNNTSVSQTSWFRVTNKLCAAVLSEHSREIFCIILSTTLIFSLNVINSLRFLFEHPNTKEEVVFYSGIFGK